MGANSNQFDTARLTKITSLGSLVGWIGTIALAAVLGSVTSLDYTVVGITLFWLVLTGAVVAYAGPATPQVIRRNLVWKYWLGASAVGIVINAGAALLVIGGVFNGTPIQETVPMQYGVMLPWLAIYAGGYLLPALYRRSSPALNTAERVIYGVAGALSLALTALLAVMPSVYPVSVLALAVVSLAPLLTLRYRG